MQIQIAMISSNKLEMLLQLYHDCSLLPKTTTTRDLEAVGWILDVSLYEGKYSVCVGFFPQTFGLT